MNILFKDISLTDSSFMNVLIADISVTDILFTDTSLKSPTEYRTGGPRQQFNYGNLSFR